MVDDRAGSVPARQPVPVVSAELRSRERLRAAGAIAAIAGVVLGVPVVLILVLGPPLQSRDGTGAVVRAILALLFWAAWLHFTACLIAECRAELRGTGLAPRIPLGGAPQNLARRLVATSVLFSGTTVLVAPMTYARAPAVPPAPGRMGTAMPVSTTSAALVAPRPAPDDRAPALTRGDRAPVTTTTDPGAGAPTQQTWPSRPEPGSSPAGPAGRMTPRVRHAELISPIADPNGRLMPNGRMMKLYEVRPAEGRHHDTLWGIAERFLGDGLRYREIFDLNEGRAQPDGRTLSKPSLIHAGWVLLLPADAQGEGLQTLHVPDSVPGWPAAETGTAPPTPGGYDLTDLDNHGPGDPGLDDPEPSYPDFEDPGPGDSDGRLGASRALAVLDDTAPVVSARNTAVVTGGPTTPGLLTSDSFGPSSQGLLGIAAASLLAAGVMVALSTRRAGPASPPEDETERALLLAADTDAARFVDRSLRVLSAGLTDLGRLLPPVYAAILTDDLLILHMAPAEEEPPPPPWTVGEAPGSWRIERMPGLPGDQPAQMIAQMTAGVPAPFPALVTFGRDDAGSRILVDLEGAPGIISLIGDLDVATEVAIAVAIELGTNVWSDDLRVCLVGFPADTGADLTTIAPARVWTADDLSAVLDELAGPQDDAGRTGVDPAPADPPTVTAGGRDRVTGNLRALAPDLLILAAPPAAADVARLTRMANGRDDAVGVLTVGDTPAARWRFTVESDRRVSLGVLGVQVRAQALSMTEYTSITALFHRADAAGSPARASGSLPDESLPDEGPPPPPVSQPPAGPIVAGPTATGPATTRPDEPTRPPSQRGSMPGALPWTPKLSALTGPAFPQPLSTVPTPAGPLPDPGSATPEPRGAEPQDMHGRAAVLPGTGFPPTISPPDDDPTRPPSNGRRLPTEPPPPTPKPPSPPRRTASAGPVLPTTTDTGDAPEAAGLLAHPGRPLIHPTDIPRVPPVVYFETPRMRANRQGRVPAESIQPGTEAPPGPPAPPPPTTGYRTAIPPRPPIPPPNERLAADAHRAPPQTARARYADGDTTVPDVGVSRPPTGTPGAAPQRVPLETTPPADPTAPAEAQVRILGLPTVEGPGRPPAERIDLLTEVIVYLALHREGVGSRLLAEEIWPSDTTEEIADAALTEARQWLGTDASGLPRIMIGPDGRWWLSPDVRCDWELFVAYTHRAGLPGSDAEADLTTALRMVSGPLWTDLPAGRYRWATTGPIARSTRAGVVDVAHRLAQLTLDFGDTMTAMAACRTGLRAVPTSEVLWRDLLRTVAARGDRRTLQAVATEMYRTIGVGGVRRGGRAEAETDALVQTLLPGFRRGRR
ncbi:hypothetical protein CcI6DRAFT_00276 [Frankia sp. CcI6]|uniref:LysM peptidoglycan-binding domain-containing protein n=1 Tax=unclassified Frankia TaxID=2632575 RepID=UPI0003D028EE|nr:MULTISPECIES: LysM peptidoglycan-binding domain-containing protein [unclassified Frankia]ETA04500.1 hypothetical protein CcI6DRAFT_00276 [Frankia sp. CcI6]